MIGREPEEALARLREGRINLRGLLPWSSNATYLASVEGRGSPLVAVYKPRSGERPLWDFPSGTLCQREVAAFELARALGWPRVPPTVLRNGPLGSGALSLFIEHDPDLHYLALGPSQRADAQRIAVFDLVANNADRKSGHVLADAGGNLWAIDHGITFHAEPKLRTVIWEFAGEPLGADIVSDLGRVRGELDTGGPLAETLGRLLAPEECAALALRLGALADARALPRPRPSSREIPWPPV